MSTGKCHACGFVGEIGVKLSRNGLCFDFQTCRIADLERNEKLIREACDQEIFENGRLYSYLAVKILKILDSEPEKEECVDEVEE